METAANPARPDASFQAMRHAMVASQLRTNAVSDPRIIAAMDRLPREAFLPASQASLAYRDTAVPLGNGRAANVPIAIGRLLTEAQLRPSDRVMLIGAAGGYVAAIIATIAQSVVAVENDPALLAIARTALADMPVVTLIDAPLEAGAPAQAPYDVIVIDGAVEDVPDAIVGQLAVDGRLVTGLVDRGVTRLAAGWRITGGFGLIHFADVDCVPLPGFTRPPAFVF